MENNGLHDDREVIDEIKARVPLVGFLEARGHKLIRSGPNRWKMLCPFHDEKTPSCSVSETYNHFKCFGCGKSGDIFTYLEDKEGMAFPDAVEMYADKLGIDYHPRHGGDDKGPDRKTLRRIVDLTYRAYRHMYSKLDEDHPAKRNIAARHIPTGNDKNHDLFGWSGGDDTLVVKALHKQGFTDEQIIAAGVAKRDRNGVCRMMWRDRLTFVIRDLMGNPVGFTGRTVYDDTTDSRKYVNSSDSPVFHKSSVLFCADIARKSASERGVVYVVEGQFDVIAMQHAGLENTVASSGTAFTSQHASLLKRMVGEGGRIVFAFDADDAGQKAAVSTFKSSPSIQYMSYATMVEGGKDESDMYRDDPQGLVRQMEDMQPLYKHVIDRMASTNDMSDEAGRNSFISGCLDAYATITDPILADNYITYMSIVSGIDAGALRAKAGVPRTHGEETDDGVGRAQSDGNAQMTPEDYMLALCYEQPDLKSRLSEVSMDGWHEQARKAILAGRELPQKVVEWLTEADDDMRSMEQIAPLTDVDGLFDAQKSIIIRRRRSAAISDYHRRMIGAVDANTDAANTSAYAHGIIDAADSAN